MIFGLLAIVSLDRHGDVPGLTLTSLLSAFPAVILVHELGHLAAGRLVGLRFSSIRVAFWTLRLEYGKLVLRARREAPGGFAGISLDRICRMRRRLFWFIAGGPIASILSVAIGVNDESIFHLHNDWAIGFLSAFVYLSLLATLLSLVPMRKGMWSDGARLEMLTRSREQTRRWFSILGLGMQASKGVPPRLWNQNWICSATRLQDRTEDERSACWLAYLHTKDCKDADRASTYLERCLSLSALTRGAINDLMMFEASVFQAWFRNDADKASQWLSRIKAPSHLPKLIRLRGAAALACARKDFPAALAAWSEGATLIDQLPETPTRRALQNGWSRWRSEIEERQLSFGR